MRLLRPALILSFAVVVVSACASKRSAAPDATAGPVVYSADQVDVIPKRKGCGDYVPPATTRDAVTLEYVVDTDGTVVRTSIRPVLNEGTRWPGRAQSAPGNVAEATRIAASCIDEPGLLDGTPVRVRLRHRFSF